MIRLKVNRRSNVLLYAEMIIALLFFVISFAVIIRVFASADSLERRSRQRQSAALCAQSIAEAYSVGGDVQKAVSLAKDCWYPVFIRLYVSAATATAISIQTANSTNSSMLPTAEAVSPMLLAL